MSLSQSSPHFAACSTVTRFTNVGQKFGVPTPGKKTTKFREQWKSTNTKYKRASIITSVNKSRAVARMTARCCCKFRYISKFTAASRGFHCHSNAFELNESPDELTATFAEICNGHLFRSILRTCVQNWKFVALPVPEIIGDTQEIWAVPGYAHTPFSPK